MISFGNLVQIKSTEETDRLSLAGLQGTVYGLSVPSSSEVQCIGSNQNDLAINVFFESRNEQYWFSDELVELVSAEQMGFLTIDGKTFPFSSLPPIGAKVSSVKPLTLKEQLLAWLFKK